ncbi:MAG: FAD-dependent oxidoreductase [Gemmatimonadales bacterium]
MAVSPQVMPRDVIVVGAGAVGLCSAIELASRGARVTLVERGLPGAANSTLTGGGIRQQFGTPTNIAMSRLSAPFWSGFAERFGVDPLFNPIGYLFIARSEAESDELRARVRLQNQLGVDSEHLAGSEIAHRWPALAPRDFVGAGFRQADGWANQHRIIDGLVRGALAAGVELLSGTECRAIERDGGRVVGIRTTDGRIAADLVVLATGPWVAPLLRPLGIDLPVVGRRHELLIVEPAMPLPAGLPWLIGVGDQVHVRPDAPGRALVGGFLGRDDPADPDSFSTRADETWAREVLARAGQVLGVVDGRAAIRHGWAGLYPATPDRHPIVDRLADEPTARWASRAPGWSRAGRGHAGRRADRRRRDRVDGRGADGGESLRNGWRHRDQRILSGPLLRPRRSRGQFVRNPSPPKARPTWTSS